MKRRMRVEQPNLEKLRDFHAFMTTQQMLYPTRLTITEKLERFATDSPFQWFWLSILRLLVIIVPKRLSDQLDNAPDRSFAKAHQRWVFGRPLSPEALSIVTTFSRLGVPRRDLRLAVFCGHIDQSGYIVVNDFREKILSALWWALALTCAISLVELAIHLSSAPVNPFIGILVFATATTFFSIILYPFYILGPRARRVGTSLFKLSNQNLIGRKF